MKSDTNENLMQDKLNKQIEELLDVIEDLDNDDEELLRNALSFTVIKKMEEELEAKQAKYELLVDGLKKDQKEMEEKYSLHEMDIKEREKKVSHLEKEIKKRSEQLFKKRAEKLRKTNKILCILLCVCVIALIVASIL